MPIMPADYFSTWYVITIGGMPTILQSYNETLNQAVSDKKLVQGDIGNHVVDIAPTYYQYNLNCPILLIEPKNLFKDTFDLVLNFLNLIQEPVYGNADIDQFNYVMQSAQLNFSTESSNCTTSLESWKAFDDVDNFKTYAPNYDFISRLVKFYDIQFGMFGENYLIQQGNFNISVLNEKHFYVSGSNNFYGNQNPLYSIHGYTVTGDVTIVLTPEQYEVLKLYNAQTPGVFTAAKNSLFVKILSRNSTGIYDKTINLGDFMFLPTVDLSISANQTITARVNFVTMFRRTSTITF
jgi:hypothetical protein